MGKMNGTTKDVARQSRNQGRKAEFTTEVTKSTKVLVGCATRTSQFRRPEGALQQNPGHFVRRNLRKPRKLSGEVTQKGWDLFKLTFVLFVLL